MATDVKQQPKWAEGSLPEGFTVDQPVEAKGGDLPEGFTVDAKPTPKQPESAIPYMLDRMKQGAAGTLALPAFGTDLIQAGLDTALGGMEKLTRPAAALGEAMGVRKPLTDEQKAENKKLLTQLGNKPDQENIGGYKMAKRGIEGLLRINDGGKNLEVPMPKDQWGGESKANEYLGSIAEFVGGSLIPGAGTVATAQRKLFTALAEFGGATAAGMGSVEGKELGEHLGPSLGLTKEQGGQIGEMFGSMFGPKGVQIASEGLARATQGSRLAAEKVKDFRDESKQTDAAKVLVQADINKALEANPTSKENIGRAAAVMKRMEGFQPNIAQQSDAPGLVAMTKEVSTKSPEAQSRAAAIDTRNRMAIDKFTEGAFPKQEVALNEGARAKYSVDSGILREQMKTTERQLTALSDQYQRSVDKGLIGEELRDLYWAKKEQTKAVLNRQVSQVYSTAERMGVREDMTDVRQAVERLRGADRETFQDMPGVFSKILQEFPEGTKATQKAVMGKSGIRRMETVPGTPGNTEANFETLHSLYKETNKQWMDLVAAGQVDKARKVNIVKDMLKQKVDKYNGPEFGQLGEQFRTFNQDYTQYSKTFKQGAGGTVGAYGKKGFKTDAEDLVDKAFLRTGDKAKGLEDFFAVYGRDERAAKLLHDGVTDSYSRAAVDANGDFNPKGAAVWMKAHARAMEELPELRAKLQATTDTAGALVDRKRELKVMQSKYDRRTVMAAAARAQDPNKLVEAGLTDPRIFKALLTSAMTPESRASLARGIVDMTAAKYGDKSFEFLKDNEKTLKPVMDALGPKHWDNLMTIAEAEQIAGRSKAPTYVELSKAEDPIERLTGTTGKGWFSRIRGLNTPMGVSKGYAALDLGGKLALKLRTEEMARIREEALLNPEMSQVLADVARKAEGPKLPKGTLLDLKRLGFDAGIVVGSQALSREADRDTQRREGKVPPPTPADEGLGKWRGKRWYEK